MRKISISDEVWKALAARGKFGETEDDVLRRIFHLVPNESESRPAGGPPGRGNKRFATKKMTARVAHDHLSVAFDNNPPREWRLPAKSDRQGIRRVKDEAVEWALSQGASDPGQTNAVRKALTDANYHLSKWSH